MKSISKDELNNFLLNNADTDAAKLIKKQLGIEDKPASAVNVESETMRRDGHIICLVIALMFAFLSLIVALLLVMPGS